LLVYTNFEHKSALSRQLPYLKGIARKHLVIVIIFENTELKSLVSKRVESIQDIYHKTIAEKFNYDKRLILKELKVNGLNAILTKPEDLTVNVINKYLEFKASGRI
jgi:archaellum biogenesis ATPase FlaH